MSGASTHPDMENLAAFRDGSLSAEAADEVRCHLEACDACRNLVALLSGEEPAGGPPPLDGPGLARLTREVLSADEVRLYVFTTSDGALVADLTPGLLPEPSVDKFFEAARTVAPEADTLRLVRAGRYFGLRRLADGTLELAVSGDLDELVLWSDDFGREDRIPFEGGRCLLGDIPAGETLEFSLLRGGRHERLVLECHAVEDALADGNLRSHLERAAARALADGRIAAFSRLEAALSGRLAGVTALTAVLAGWRTLALNTWARIVLLGRPALRGPAEESDFIVIGDEAEEVRLEQMQPWLPFEAELVRQRRDDSNSVVDNAFFNLARKKLCEQSLRLLDREYAEGLRDAELYRTRSWLLFATGDLVESMHSMEQAMHCADYGEDEDSRKTRDKYTREYRVLMQLDKGDAARWPAVPQDIFDTLWRLGAERLGRPTSPGF